jgi:uncharacterized membrane protein YbhN (UPF0104 family)
MKAPHVSLPARLLVSAAVIVALILWLPRGELLAAISRVSFPLWLGAVAVFLAGHQCAALKWRLLMPRPRPPVLRASRAHFLGLAANLWLPGGLVGGDVVRAALGMRGSTVKEAVAAASLVDRILDTLGLLILAAVGALWTASLEGVFAQALAAAAALGVVGLAAGGFLFVRLRRSGSAALRRFAAALSELAADPGRAALALALSMGIQATFILVTARLAVAAGVDVSAGVWFAAWPLAKIVALIPITFAGIGVREGALVVLMRPFGAPAAAVTAAGLLWQSVVFAGGLLGGALALAAPAAGGAVLPRPPTSGPEQPTGEASPAAEDPD